ncbi:hypothetical protein ABT390_21790 [Streptomyces aurantiacus]|uniref:Uncharacterized protein n=1 Tax=Streptomyces aurantiacus JA 4570 TaxID=1286094 RepID=S3ZHS8_9ACTN|nr:hypothetical protein [Streptomyces aurantiacus]EPH42683.1 hypothetical protein STRAU_4270 [Streptomyces aurantiacus JA 4570]
MAEEPVRPVSVEQGPGEVADDLRFGTDHFIGGQEHTFLLAAMPS